MRMQARLWWLLLALTGCPNAWAVKTVTWDRSVIGINLLVGVEQMVHFEGPATIGVPESLISHNLFRHVFAGNTAYWKAMRPFDTQRIKVRLDHTGEFLLFDVSARTLKKPPKKVEAINVVVARAKAPPTKDPAAVTAAHDAPVRANKAVSMFDLLRYAAQTDYSPPRVVAALDGVREIENEVTVPLNTLYRDPINTSIDLFARRQWAVDGWYVTAIEIHNRNDFPVLIDPSKLQHTAKQVVNGLSNQFIASAMVVRSITAHDGGLDRTMVYVVTDQPFRTVIDL